MIAKIVVDLGFGDAGKGHTVDSLCIDAKNPIVVRFSGGQQCGHMVYTDENTSHIHSSFGSGTLRGVPSYFTPHCTMYLNSIMREHRVLKTKGCEPKLYIHPFTKATTPYDVAFNRLTHKIHGHGSVGLGIGATMDRHINTGYKVYAIDFTNETMLKLKLEKVKSYYEEKLHLIGFSASELEEEVKPYLKEFWSAYKKWKTLFEIQDFQILKGYEELIFEGSQGIMLDMDHGTFPNVTYAKTTSHNALEIAYMLRCDDIQLYYVTRCYLTRHGNGWLPEGENLKLVNDWMELNKSCPYQGKFKTRDISAELLDYALSIDAVYSYSPSLRKNLVITCLDQLPSFKVDDLLKQLKNHKFNGVFTSESHISKSMLFRQH